MRANIFERLSEADYDIQYETQKIYSLFREKIGRKINITIYNSTEATLEELVDELYFCDWRQRGSLLSLHEFKSKISLINIEGKLSKSTTQNIFDKSPLKIILDPNEILELLEYILNINILAFKLTKQKEILYCFNKYKVEIDYYKLNTLDENINIMLEHLNFEVHENEEEEKLIIIEKNASVTAVAEIITKDLFWPTIEYNHYLLRGNITRKREILKKLADDLEHKREQLKSLKKSAEDILFCMFNNLNIRHNNSDIELVVSMSNKKLESLYDEVYQLILYSYLILDNQPRIKMLEELKQSIEESKKQRNKS
ncbi:MAG: hypothetical protein FWE14_02510 [Lachnospiraceae bacterium]|nr:hypothetical protein [Lachnospiraceae bacterium]